MEILGKCKTILSRHWPLVAASATLALSCFMQARLKKPIIIIPKQDSVITLNTTFLKLMAIGHRRMISDFMWIQTLLESDLEHYKKNDLNNWMYLRFNQISELDPLFYENYLYGGLYLSVVKDDPIAGIKIFEKGITHYPEDFNIRFNLGFTQYFDLGNFKAGLDSLQHIENNPKLSPPMRSVIAKLRLETTLDYDLAFSMVKQNYENTTDPNIRENLRFHLYSIKAERDLDCLNKVIKIDCDRYDLDGKLYLYNKARYSSPKPIKLFRVKVRNRKQTP
jgi:hypothetical protein